MYSSDSVPGTQAEPVGMASWVNQTRHLGFGLFVVGAISLSVGLLSWSFLVAALGLIMGLAGLRQMWMCQQLDAEVPAPADQESVVFPAIATLGCQALLLSERVMRAACKVLACLFAGLGVGLITVGVFALRQPELWQPDVLSRTGPPLGPVALGIGVGLLCAEVLLLLLFCRGQRTTAEPGAR